MIHIGSCIFDIESSQKQGKASNSIKSKTLQWRIFFILWSVLIFITIPLLPLIWRFLFFKVGREINLLATILGIIFISCFCFAIFLRKARGKTDSILWLGLTSLSYFLIISKLKEFPAERLHLIEYGFLGILGVYTQSPLSSKLSRYSKGLTLAAFIGVVDELIQAVTPNRECQVQDILLNLFSIILGFCIKEFVIGESSFRKKYSRLILVTGYFIIGFIVTFSYYWNKVPERYNILLLTIDALRPDHLGCYGYPKNTSPNIDKIAAQGKVFTRAFAVSAWTSPNLVSIMTSLYPSVHGVKYRDQSMRQEFASFPRILREYGYACPDLTYLTSDPNFYFLGFDSREKSMFHGDTGEETLNWLTNNPGKLFFIWYHYSLVHLPYRMESGLFREFFQGIFPDSSELSPGLKACTSEMMIPENSKEFYKDDEKKLNALYDGEVKAMDQYFGKIAEILEHQNRLSNTIIILTADHGEELLDHGFVGHASTAGGAKLFDEIIRIPLIIFFPARVKPGSFEVKVSSLDILPTVLGLAGIKMPEEYFQGRNLSKYVKHDLTSRQKSHIEKPVFAETNTGGYQASLTQNAPWKTSIRTDDFKLIEKNYENRQKEFLFFDLLNDPGENADLYPSMDPAQKGIFDELSGEIGDFKNNNFSFRAALDSEDTKKIIEDSADSQRRNCPEIIIPVHGELISPKESGALIVIEWKGLKEENYVVEYNVGKDPYHLQGTFIVKGRRQEFGPFIGENWNKLTYYNPWSFRVWAESQPGCKSEWVVFNLDKYTSSQVDKGKTENNKAIESFPLFPENM